MRTLILISLILVPLAQAQTPTKPPATPAAKPPAEMSADEGWYRMTYQHLPVGFAHELWKTTDFHGKEALEMHLDGQFTAKPETLRDLPYADYIVDLVFDKASMGLQHGDYEVSFPVQVSATSEASEFKLVQGEVQFAIDRETAEGHTWLVFHSNDTDVPDARLPLEGMPEYLVPDAIPRLLASRPRPWKGMNAPSVALKPGVVEERNPEKYVTSVDVVVKDKTKTKIGEEDVDVTPVLVTSTGASEVQVTTVYLIDDKNLVRKTWTTLVEPQRIMPEQEPSDTVIATRVATETEAREGLAFVFAQKHRRDPFVDPRTARKGEGVVVGAGGAPTGTKASESNITLRDAQEYVKEAQNALDDINKLHNKGDKLSPDDKKAMSTAAELIYDRKAKLEPTKWVQQKQTVANIADQARLVVGAAVDLELTKARTLARNIEETFKNDDEPSTQRLQEITQMVEQIRVISGAGLSKEGQAEVKTLLADAQKIEERAKIRVEFDSEKPEIRGTVYQQVDVKTPLKLGIVLFGRPLLIDTQIPLPKSKSMIILKLKNSKSDDNQSFNEGDRIGEPPSPLYVKRIMRNRVCFEYKGEEIWISTAQQ